MHKCLLVVVFAAALGGRCLAETPIAPASERTTRLAEWEGLKYGMFLTFGMSTFEGVEMSTGKLPSTAYAPTKLDVRQWVHTAKQAGMGYAVLTAKHVAGHCLWPSEGYDYGVTTSGNKTDVVGEFMKACKEEGIKPGIYYCLLDTHNETGFQPTGAVGDQYFQLIKRHITDLHTHYPGIYEQWIDGPHKLSPQQRQEIYALIKKLSPDCLVLGNAGYANGTKVLPGTWPTDLLDGERTVPPSRHNPVKTVDGRTYYLPMEECDTISMRWFWAPNDPPKTVRTLYKLYVQTVGRGANLLLNVPPDKTGRIPQEYVDTLMELKKVIDDPSRLAQLPKPESLTFGCRTKASSVWGRHPLWAGENAVDDDPGTFWLPRQGVKQAWLEVDLGKPTTFDRARLIEAENRVRRFELQAKQGDAWKTFATGTTIGNSVELRFEPVKAQVVRLNLLKFTESPKIREFQLFAPK